MSTSPTHARAAAGGALSEMTTEQCWEHLARRTVGRMAYVDRDGPVIVPLNYRVGEGRIWVRTASYDQLAVHLPHQQAAFEVDHVDEHARTGWSVLVRGRAEHVVAGPGESPADWPDPQPWPEGLRQMTFALFPSTVTGRVLHQGDVSPAAGEARPGNVQRHPARTAP
jgi:hypothetical protein